MILFEIEIHHESDPATSGYAPAFIRLRYLGGATGQPKGRVYKVGDAPPAFTNFPPGSSPTIPIVAALGGQAYIAEYADDSITSKQLGIVNVLPWPGSCMGGLKFTSINTSFTRFSGKIAVGMFGPSNAEHSIDGGTTYKNGVYSGLEITSEWTNAELDLLGYTALVPNVLTRAKFLANAKSIEKIEASTYPGFSGPSFINVKVGPGYTTSGLAVGQMMTFKNCPGYSSGPIVAIPGPDYVVIQHAFSTNAPPYYTATFGLLTTCPFELGNNFLVGETLPPPPFTLSETHTNVTVADGSDGSINVSTTGGSGSFTAVWDDAVTGFARTGLVAGIYRITVTDAVTGQVESLTVEITEPTPTPVTEGTFVQVPFMNSLQWVDKTEPSSFINNPQALDNRLLCEQYFDGFEKTNYFNKVCRSDTRILQFNSDYADFKIEMFDYRTDAKVKDFGFVIKEQNIGIPEDFAVSIRNHAGFPGQSRVYFGVGAIPIPLNVGDVFTIYNNLDGFDGSYAIASIENDFTLGYQYLVINKNYAIPATSSPATGRFFTSVVDFNVFESAMTFSDVPDGQYYCTLRALNSLGIPSLIHWVSEPIEIAAVWEKTNLIEYRNVDNAFGITWTTGYVGQLRVESALFKRMPGGERSTNRNADYSLTKINAKKQRIVLFETHYLPPYLHEKLSTAFDCDSWTINKVAFQSAEAYSEPQYIDAFMLASASIKVEQQHWFDGYNSDDLGTVNEGGFLLHEGGYIKL